MMRASIPQPTRIESAARIAGAWHEPGTLWHQTGALPEPVVEKWLPPFVRLWLAVLLALAMWAGIILGLQALLRALL